MTDTKKIVVLCVLGIGLIAFFMYTITKDRTEKEEPVACTAEAKQCPDGSYVGRTGPDCSFAECPNEKEEGGVPQTETPDENPATATGDLPPSSDVGMEFPVADKPEDGTGTVCTEEAKQCPDGSFVGRTGPNCTFEKCPGEKEEEPPQVGLPYCESAPVEEHFARAREYLEEQQYTDYSVIEESAEQTGPCNNGNTAWTVFDVEDTEGVHVGDITVNGDTEEVTFEEKTEPEPSEHTIDINGYNYAFDKSEIRVQEGDTVTINFTSEEGLHDWVIDEFEAATERVNDGETTSVTFVADETGTFEYYCSVGNHRAQGMVGELIVESR